MTDWTTVRLSRELRERVDEARGEVALARWVAGACEARLDYVPVMALGPTTAGTSAWSKARARARAAAGSVPPGVAPMKPAAGSVPPKGALRCRRCEWWSPDVSLTACPVHGEGMVSLVR